MEPGANERRRGEQTPSGGRAPPGRTSAAGADDSPPERTNARRSGRTIAEADERPPERANAAGADERRRGEQTPPWNDTHDRNLYSPTNAYLD